MMAMHLSERDDLPDGVREVLIKQAAIWDNARRPKGIKQVKRLTNEAAQGNQR